VAVIEPTVDDIGRKVIYRERGDHPGRKVEEGVITRVTPLYVFVRYGTSAHSAATDRADLEFTNS
jgi:hypothetical protein